MKKYFILIMLLFFKIISIADTIKTDLQSSEKIMKPESTSNTVQMADGLFQSGKIYVVVILICIIFATLFLYLITIDRKLNRIENNLKDK